VFPHKLDSAWSSFAEHFVVENIEGHIVKTRGSSTDDDGSWIIHADENYVKFIKKDLFILEPFSRISFDSNYLVFITVSYLHEEMYSNVNSRRNDTLFVKY